MPDPVWSFQYSLTQTPEQQGFSRVFNSGVEPAITLVTGGSPANRRIQVNTDNGGDVSFITSNIPSFNSAVGFTSEALVNVSGAGDAGFEARFVELFCAINIFQDRVYLERGDDSVEVATPSNAADILWRLTFDGTNVRVYRAGSLVIGPVAPKFFELLDRSFQKFQFWAEGGGTVIFKQMKYYIAGAVVPG